MPAYLTKNGRILNFVFSVLCRLPVAAKQRAESSGEKGERFDPTGARGRAPISNARITNPGLPNIITGKGIELKETQRSKIIYCNETLVHLVAGFFGGQGHLH